MHQRTKINWRRRNKAFLATYEEEICVSFCQTSLAIQDPTCFIESLSCVGTATMLLIRFFCQAPCFVLINHFSGLFDAFAGWNVLHNSSTIALVSVSMQLALVLAPLCVLERFLMLRVQLVPRQQQTVANLCIVMQQSAWQLSRLRWALFLVRCAHQRTR